MSLKFQTKNQAVYEALRQGIIEGKLKPGQKIVMSEVAKGFGLSDIPVREAIRRLESDKFVRFTPLIGAVASETDEHEFVEADLIRIELESLATRLAVPHILGAINRDFHLRIYRAAPYAHLNQLISILYGKE